MKTFLLLLSCLIFFSCGKDSKNSSPQNFQDTSALELSYLDLFNDHREKLGMNSLVNLGVIEEIAFEHSFNMAQGTARFGHGGFNNRCRRLENELRSSGCGEIVARGQKTSKDVLSAWLNSPAHRKSIENPSYTHTGLGLHKDASGRPYWTQIFVTIN
ncbi:MAG: CAP domain-containing protein [Bacteriovoracaceae bacterium]|nr:CAP domain-containing protein [Bacteriovoracaceae bacterium]